MKWLFIPVVVLAACADPNPVPCIADAECVVDARCDKGTCIPGARPVDGGPVDGGPVDGGPVDGGPVDAGGQG